MINVNNEGIRIEGTSTILLSELTSVMHLLVNRGIAGEEMLTECVRLATMSDDERRKEAEQVMTDMMCSVFGLPKMKPSQFDDMMKVVNELMKEMEDKQ